MAFLGVKKKTDLGLPKPTKRFEKASIAHHEKLGVATTLRAQLREAQKANKNATPLRNAYLEACDELIDSIIEMQMAGAEIHAAAEAVRQ